MKTKPTLGRANFATTFTAAALSTCIALGLLAAVAGLFQRDGTPFEQVVIAERACANLAYVSDRETCVRSYLAAAATPKMASR